ncbi:MAG: hypothetical protein ACI8X5_000707 [Planctomycetota bacterium]
MIFSERDSAKYRGGAVVKLHCAALVPFVQCEAELTLVTGSDVWRKMIEDEVNVEYLTLDGMGLSYKKS